MLNKDQLNKIKEAAEEFFSKMTVSVDSFNVVEAPSGSEEKESVNLEIRLKEPQTLIGQGGQTLFEIQRLLRMVLNKKLQSIFYLDLDINDYKKSKSEYLRGLVKEAADQVSLTKQEKSLPPMSSYDRRIAHSELSDRSDVFTESRGEGETRHVVVRPR